MTWKEHESVMKRRHLCLLMLMENAGRGNSWILHPWRQKKQVRNGDLRCIETAEAGSSGDGRRWNHLSFIANHSSLSASLMCQYCTMLWVIASICIFAQETNSRRIFFSLQGFAARIYVSSERADRVRFTDVYNVKQRVIHFVICPSVISLSGIVPRRTMHSLAFRGSLKLLWGLTELLTIMRLSRLYACTNGWHWDWMVTLAGLPSPFELLPSTMAGFSKNSKVSLIKRGNTELVWISSAQGFLSRTSDGYLDKCEWGASCVLLSEMRPGYWHCLQLRTSLFAEGCYGTEAVLSAQIQTNAFLWFQRPAGQISANTCLVHPSASTLRSDLNKCRSLLPLLT